MVIGKNKNKRKLFSFKELGLAEMLVALLPILGAYYLGPVPFSFWILLVLSVVSMFMGKRINMQMMKPLFVFFVYFSIHEVLVLIVADSFNINNRIETSVSILSILFIVPLLNLNKLKACLYFVAVVCIIGLLYQYIIVVAGGTVHPLEIPGLQMPEFRLLTETNRPSSFFMEPAAYAFYMYAPIFLSLMDRRFIWTAILILSVFLSSSTTGLFASFIILVVYLISQGSFKGRAIKGRTITTSIAIVGIVALMVMSLLYTDYFSIGIEKLNNTNFETNVRIWQGPMIVKTMRYSEMIFGVPYGDVMDYVRDGRVQTSLLYGEGTDVFMSTIWRVIFKLGIVGLLLYLNIFYRIVKDFKLVLPLILCLFVVMFTGSMYLGGWFVFYVIMLYLMKKTLVGGDNTIPV